NTLSLTGDGTLGTTNKQSLTIGTPSTGNITISQAGAITTINGTAVLSAFGTAGIVHNSANGTLTSSLVDLTSDVTGVLPISNGGSPFNEANGSIFARRITDDFLLGGTSTASANFAFLNNAGGTPTASVAGNLIVMPNTAGGALGGNVGIGTTNPNAPLTVQGVTPNGTALITNG